MYVCVYRCVPYTHTFAVNGTMENHITFVCVYLESTFKYPSFLLSFVYILLKEGYVFAGSCCSCKGCN